ncbi:hypothetical protein [Legionella sp.]|uniref:hypothetical protein n=1 Tax=Legionella sp. TaxID=459 RepID=UPI003C8CB561
MNQRLVWNFEFSFPTTTFQPEILIDEKSEDIKWEVRFFWPDEEIIILNPIDNSLLDLANYQRKHREDYYFLLPGSDYNIKRRHHKLLYKPLLKQSKLAFGFTTKLSIPSLDEDVKKSSPHLQEIAHRVATEGKEVYVKKEALIYKFPSTPRVKLELARLKVDKKIYYSACIEGKSRALVECIAEHLLDKRVSCQYVTFLKNILHL